MLSIFKSYQLSVIQTMNLLLGLLSIILLKKINPLKKLDMSTPHLYITQTIKSVNRLFNGNFNKNICIQYECGCDCKNALVCLPCLLFSSGEDTWIKSGPNEINYS